MAVATYTLTQSARLEPLGSKDQKTLTFWGSITFSAAADTYATGGVSPLATTVLKALGPYANTAPLAVTLHSARGTGFQYQFDTSTNKILIFSGAAAADGTTGAVQLTNGTALNATTPTISTDVVRYEIVFPYGSLTGA